MSMKRARRANTSAKGSQSESTTGFGAPAPAKTWAERIDGKAETVFRPYAPSTTFHRDEFVMHTKFGKGVVTLVEGSRVEVLFEEGLKKLAHSQTA